MARARVTMTWNGPQVRREMREASARGLYLGAEYVLGESTAVVPLDEAALQRSGTATVDGATLTAAVSYDTPYAVPQHERLDYEHAPGRKAKFLEDSLNESRHQVRDLLAAELRRRLR